MLARAGHEVTLIGRHAHMQAIANNGLQLDLAKASGIESVDLHTSTEIASVHQADLVLFCVKSTDSESVAKHMAPYLLPHAVVVSLQNGVENAILISQHIKNAVIPAVVYVATEIAAPGCVKHHGRGDLVIGTMSPPRLIHPHQTLTALVELFASAQVEVRISDNVMVELWSKLMVNCAFNAISGLSQLAYGKLAERESIRSTQADVVKEVIAVAKADGVVLSEPEALQTVANIAVAMAGQKSSTAQDMARHKISEIDHLNGFIVRRGFAHGIATPVNQALYALVKLVESSYAESTT
jgi:2-dehydropantoate 2-reductase